MLTADLQSIAHVDGAQFEELKHQLAEVADEAKKDAITSVHPGPGTPLIYGVAKVAAFGLGAFVLIRVGYKLATSKLALALLAVGAGYLLTQVTTATAPARTTPEAT